MKTMQNKKLDVGFSPRDIELADGTRLFFWYANNAGRGKNNCTIIRSNTDVRAPLSKDQQGVIARARTCSWHGRVNFSWEVQRQLGL